MSYRDIVDAKFRKAVIHGAISTCFSIIFSYLFLELYVITSISVGHAGLIDQMVEAGLIAVGYASFFSGFFSSYFTSLSSDR
jgi:hypothetical protein